MASSGTIWWSWLSLATISLARAASLS
ncbi:MAG: hypothetical protein JWN92_2364, partial [Candidatus Acidoferrum typicum]|nr:hypothetical protein [Candidatus Acidoferrum typicum]